MHVRQFFLTLTYACDSDCNFCGIPKQIRLAKRNFSFDELKEQIDKLGLLNSDIITLSGGEPLISPFLTSICEYINKKYGSRISILTNGRFLSDLKFVEKLKDLNLYKLTIPILSYDSNLHNTITNRKNSFKETLNGINNLTILKIPYEIKFIALKSNHEHLLDTYTFIKDRFVEARFIFSGLTYFGEVLNNLEDLSIRYIDIAPSLDKLLLEAERRQELVPVFMYPLCMIDPIFWKHYTVGSYEEVVVAPDYIGQADGRSLKAGPKPNKCSSCKLRNRCVFGWKPAYHKIHGDSEFQPIL